MGISALYALFSERMTGLSEPPPSLLKMIARRVLFVIRKLAALRQLSLVLLDRKMKSESGEKGRRRAWDGGRVL